MTRSEIEKLYIAQLPTMVDLKNKAINDIIQSDIENLLWLYRQKTFVIKELHDKTIFNYNFSISSLSAAWKTVITRFHKLPRIVKRNKNIKELSWFDYEKVIESVIGAEFIVNSNYLIKSVSSKMFSSKSNLFFWRNAIDYFYIDYVEVSQNYNIESFEKDDILFLVADNPDKASFLSLGTAWCFYGQPAYFEQYKLDDGKLLFYQKENTKFVLTCDGVYQDNGDLIYN